MALSVKLTCLAAGLLTLGQLALYTPSVSGFWVPRKGRVWCPTGWVRFRRSCYIFIQDPQTWPEAQMSCEVLGGNLVRIDRPNENAFIRKLLGKDGRAWLGVNDLEKEGQFKLIHSQHLARLDHFMKGEPNNLHVNEHCVEMLSSGKWNDLSCSRRRSFVCEFY